MYKEITIDPSCMTEFHYYGLVKNQFGFEKGRYLAVSIKDWVKEAFPLVKESNLEPIKKRSVQNFLYKLQKAKPFPEQVYLANDRKVLKYEKGESWQDWVQRQIELRQFTAVISENGIENCLNFDDVMDEHDNWIIHPSVSINKTAKEIIDAIEPMLPFCKYLTIIDNYFGIGKNGSQAVLHELFYRAKKYNCLKKVTLITNIKDKDPVKTFNDKIKSKHPSLPEFELIDDLPDGFFHDRYVLSERMAIKVGQGLSEELTKGTAADLLHFNLISSNEVKSNLDLLNTERENGNATTQILNEG